MWNLFPCENAFCNAAKPARSIKTQFPKQQTGEPGLVFLKQVVLIFPISTPRSNSTTFVPSNYSCTQRYIKRVEKHFTQSSEKFNRKRIRKKPIKNCLRLSGTKITRNRSHQFSFLFKKGEEEKHFHRFRVAGNRIEKHVFPRRRRHHHHQTRPNKFSGFRFGGGARRGWCGEKTDC